MGKLHIEAEYDQTNAQKLRQLKDNPQARARIAEINHEINDIARQFIGEIKRADPPACPCFVSDLLETLDTSQLNALVHVEASLAAAKIRRGSVSMQDHFQIVTHALHRLAEIEADAVLQSAEIAGE